MSEERAQARIENNPFYVLELAPDCSRIEAERQGQKLMAMLELGLEAAAEYQTPLGPRSRTTDGVRTALAELRDPRKRLAHELWYVGRDPVRTDRRPSKEQSARLCWYGARRAHGWGRE